MNTAFDIKLEAKDLSRFNMYQTHTGLQGWISIILGILAFVMAGITFGHAETMYTMLYIGVGILFGWIPSVKAANLNPIDALRYE